MGIIEERTRQLSQRPPGMLTRPRHPRGWFTQEYMLLCGC
jgi:hypothetical protein